jgi:AcrR family transcriptional regulator
MDKNIAHFEVLGRRYDLPYLSEGGSTKEDILIESTVLFATKGYATVSMRDIAGKVGITPGALYNHFSSKEDLWNAVLSHTIGLYRLYHEQLEETLKKANTFEEVVNCLFSEPAQMRNLFTCYGFGLLQTEQFRDSRAGESFTNLFLDYGINFAKKWFDICVERGLVRAFNTRLMAAVFVHTVMIGIDLRVQESLNREIPCSISQMFEDLRLFILEMGKE